MLPSTKTCLHKKGTMGSYSIAVIGIILFALTVTICLSVLGVGINAHDGIQMNNFEMPYIPEKKPIEIISQEIPPEIKISEDQSVEINSDVSEGAFVGLCDVSVPKSGSLGRFDTVPGKIEIIAQSFPTSPLPLCIDNDYLANYYMVVRSIGGYEPLYGEVLVNQIKDTLLEGKIIPHFTALPKEAGCFCCTQDYMVTFTVCDGPICLDSNHLPEGFDQERTLGKWVDICAWSVWTGCVSPDQEFVVILAHKAMSQNPKLPIIKTSPV